MARIKQVKYKLNLSQLFGTRFPNDSSLRDTIAQEVLDRIIERTQSGIDKNGQKFKPYSAAYAKAKGVSRDSVDLTLYGDMLESMDIVDATAETVVLGFPDSHENAKAYNHTEGVTVPRRDFFGLPQEELDTIKDKYIDEVLDAKARKSAGIQDEDFEVDSRKIIEEILLGQRDEELGI